MEGHDASSLAEYFADIITSEHNQHAIVRIVGSAGMGKSWAAITLAHEVSKVVAERKGGQPEDYYSFEKDLAVMSKEDIKRIFTNPGQYHILHADDIGVPVNARNYKSQYNIDFNDTIQTFRPNHNLVLMTMQAGFLIDKVPRTLAHYEIEMEQQLFDYGITIAKVNKIVIKHKTDQLYYPYIFINGTKYIRHIFERPPKELTERYEIERAKQLKKLNAPEEQENSQPIELTKKEKAIELKRDFDAGVFGDNVTFKQVCKLNKINYGYAMNCI